MNPQNPAVCDRVILVNSLIYRLNMYKVSKQRSTDSLRNDKYDTDIMQKVEFLKNAYLTNTNMHISSISYSKQTNSVVVYDY